MQKKSPLYRLILTAILLALGIVLPFLTLQNPALGKAFCLLHIPSFICGLTCGPLWGASFGFILPLFRSWICHMPAISEAVPMAFEMAVYGLICGLAYPMMRRITRRSNHLAPLVLVLVIAMLAGRIVGGAAKAMVMGLSDKPYTFSTMVKAYFVDTAPGALIHIILVPAIVIALEKAKLSPLGQERK